MGSRLRHMFAMCCVVAFAACGEEADRGTAEPALRAPVCTPDQCDIAGTCRANLE